MSTWPEMLDRIHATLAEAEARVGSANVNWKSRRSIRP